MPDVNNITVIDTFGDGEVTFAVATDYADKVVGVRLLVSANGSNGAPDHILHLTAEELTYLADSLAPYATPREEEVALPDPAADIPQTNACPAPTQVEVKRELLDLPRLTATDVNVGDLLLLVQKCGNSPGVRDDVDDYPVFRAVEVMPSQNLLYAEELGTGMRGHYMAWRFVRNPARLPV